ncbi:MAG: DUF692 family protein [Candidatus Omnitrophica bacterium]|nr:DUF692 family protein [Candidatus Omnitrophota bacterium]
MRSDVVPRLCVASSDAALAAADALAPLIAAVTYKRYRPEPCFPNATAFMDTPVNIIDEAFGAQLEELGLWRLMARRSVQSVACDFGPAVHDVETVASPNGYPRYHLRGPRLGEPEYIALARRHAAWLRARFPGTLRVENLNYFPTPSDAYGMVCDPGFMGRVLEAIDAELLLDVAHARISAENLGTTPEAYLEALPLHRVREVQISACGPLSGIWEDLHEPPGPREWELLEWLCARAPVEFVTIEYYRDAGRLVAAYRELAQRVGTGLPFGARG